MYEQMGQFGYWNIKNKQFFPGCYLKNITSQDNQLNNNDTIEFRGLIASNRMLTYNHKEKKRQFNE